jgi:hypothetical protein
MQSEYAFDFVDYSTLNALPAIFFLQCKILWYRKPRHWCTWFLQATSRTSDFMLCIVTFLKKNKLKAQLQLRTCNNRYHFYIPSYTPAFFAYVVCPSYARFFAFFRRPAFTLAFHYDSPDSQIPYFWPPPALLTHNLRFSDRCKRTRN